MLKGMLVKRESGRVYVEQYRVALFYRDKAQISRQNCNHLKKALLKP